jgi:CRP/FNR family cyclic AMP-dependent transcriptional regulator
VVPGGILDLLSADDRRSLLTQMPRRTYRKHDTLFHEGDPGDSVHVIEKGHVAIRTSTRAGDVATLTVLGPGGSLGEQALLAPTSSRTASAVALDLVETRVLHRAAFEQLRADHPEIERFLIEVLASQVRRLTAQLLDALYVAADERVVRRLADLVDIYGDGGPNVNLPVKQDDLASMAGTTRPTANRVLKQLESESVLELRRGSITVVDLDRLRRLSDRR